MFKEDTNSNASTKSNTERPNTNHLKTKTLGRSNTLMNMTAADRKIQKEIEELQQHKLKDFANFIEKLSFE